MTKDDARDEIRLSSQSCEEIGLGNEPLNDAQLAELEQHARALLAAIAAYRGTAEPTEKPSVSLRQVAEAVIKEHDQCVGEEGPSYTLRSQAQAALDEMVRLSEEAGLYDDPLPEPRRWHDDRQREVCVFLPEEWERIKRALNRAADYRGDALSGRGDVRNK